MPVRMEGKNTLPKKVLIEHEFFWAAKITLKINLPGFLNFHHLSDIVCPTLCIMFNKGGIDIYTSRSTINLIRYVVAYVFITSGFMKLISEELGNHFISLGLPYPLKMMYALAIIEIICGIFILVNKGVKNATIPLIAIMIAALLLTKFPFLHSGFVQFAFNARLDIVILVLLIFLYTRLHEG